MNCEVIEAIRVFHFFFQKKINTSSTKERIGFKILVDLSRSARSKSSHHGKDSTVHMV